MEDEIEVRVEEKVKKDRTFFANNKKGGNNRSKRVGEKKKFSDEGNEGIFLSDLNVNMQVVQPLQSTPHLPAEPLVARTLGLNHPIEPNVKVINSQRTSAELGDLQTDTISIGTLRYTPLLILH